MNKNSITKRLEALENQTSENLATAMIHEHPDGRIDGDPAEVAKAGWVIHLVGVAPRPGGGGPLLTEDELEAMYPGRRERLAAWERAVKTARQNWR